MSASCTSPLSATEMAVERLPWQSKELMVHALKDRVAAESPRRCRRRHWLPRSQQRSQSVRHTPAFGMKDAISCCGLSVPCRVTWVLPEMRKADDEIEKYQQTGLPKELCRPPLARLKVRNFFFNTPATFVRAFLVAGRK